MSTRSSSTIPVPTYRGPHRSAIIRPMPDAEPRVRRAVGACLLLLLVACGGSSPTSPGSAATPTPDPGTAAPDVDDLLGRMTLEEKVGQMTQVDRQYLAREGD